MPRLGLAETGHLFITSILNFEWGLKHLLTHAARATTFSAMAASAAIFTGTARFGTCAGAMMIFNAESITGKSSSKGGNSHQGGNSKHSFHN